MSESIKTWPSESRKTAKSVFYFLFFFGRRHQQQRKTGPNNYPLATHTNRKGKEEQKEIKKTQIEFLVSFSQKLTQKKKETSFSFFQCNYFLPMWFVFVLFYFRSPFSSRFPLFRFIFIRRWPPIANTFRKPFYQRSYGDGSENNEGSGYRKIYDWAFSTAPKKIQQH